MIFRSSAVFALQSFIVLTTLPQQADGFIQATIWKRQDDGIPSSPPWVGLGAILPAPECMSNSPDCPYEGSTTLDACSAEKCTMTFIGACMQTGTMVDKSCVCKADLNENTCSACTGTKARTPYLYWLNSTCGDIEGWEGLSADWTEELPEISLIEVGNATYIYGYYSYTACTDLWDVDCIISYYSGYNTSSVSDICTGFNSLLWEPNIYNASEAAAVTPQVDAKNYSSEYLAYPSYYDPLTDHGVFLDLHGYCQNAILPNENICATDASHAKLLFWSLTLCNPVSVWGWPDDWESDIPYLDSGFIEQSNWPALPAATEGHSCSAYINNIEGNCTSERCKGELCSEIVKAISLSCYCKEMDISSKCDSDGLDLTADYLLLNSTCTSVAEFPGLPLGWQDKLLIMNSSYGAPSNFTSWPKCANAANCYSALNGSVTNCAQTLCEVDFATSLCNSTITGVKPECFCSPVSYENTCNTNCKLSWEREEYLNWMNTTCSPVYSWGGLPSNWVDLLQVQDTELLPWSWRIQIAEGAQSAQDPALARTEAGHCPSVAQKLAAFAAVNAAMALLTPILGRRDVMKKITFGVFGKRASMMWLLTGPLTVLLHVASNAIAALLIKRTRGFEGVDVGQLILLWCTRPRLAWMVVILIPFQAADEIYFSVASSTLLAEMVLQGIGAYYMGTATNYARRQKFYEAGRLIRTHKGKDAMVMYAGSIIWLCVIFIAVATCIWSLLGMSLIVLFKKIARVSLAGMMGCFVAQWVWWTGYIKVSDETYCPPQLGKITVIWIIFSVSGAMIGGGL
ncbi:hypothetical protein K458DRAFT_345854 [Lentithecium fluviatile CBS 122367]|uniref:Extracellular membrane protein CFEM domain-containing protein n=1 Tax=Lentithecium fluviatile CBS 122367 TaxID=1168545 RepID=A0A6G1IQ28_9PLEO|nr:hypothetical protein K458DRAFT_345854 [Lentithecium fluviatile CBS 122367]